MAGHDPYGQYGTSKYPSHRGHHPQDRAAGSQQGHPEHGRQQWGQPDARGQAGAWGQPGEEADDQRRSWYQQPPPDAPRKPGQRATPSRKRNRRTWVAAAAALLVGIILGNLSGGGDAEPAVAEAGVPPEAATPGSCLRVIDLARGGKVNSQEFEAASGDCRAKAAPTGGEQPVTTENPPAAKPPDSGAVAVGQPAKDGNFTFVVGGVECGATTIGDNQFLSAEAQGEFCLVSVSVTNHGNEAQYLTTGAQVLIDGQGREYAVDDEAWAALEDAPLLEQINPGLSVDGTLVFDVPPGTKPVSARLHDSLLSGGVTVTFG